MIIMIIIKALFVKYKPKNGFSRFMGSLLGLVNGALIAIWIFLTGTAIIGVPSLTAGMDSQTNSSFSMKLLSSFVPNTYSQVFLQDHEGNSYLDKAIKEAEKSAGIVRDETPGEENPGEENPGDETPGGGEIEGGEEKV
jgi:uncharacterized membrane protein required for colicin V production